MHQDSCRITPEQCSHAAAAQYLMLWNRALGLLTNTADLTAENFVAQQRDGFKPALEASVAERNVDNKVQDHTKL